MTQRGRALAAGSRGGGSQLPITPAPENLIPCSTLLQSLHTRGSHSHRHIHISKNANKSFLSTQWLSLLLHKCHLQMIYVICGFISFLIGIQSDTFSYILCVRMATFLSPSPTPSPSPPPPVSLVLMPRVKGQREGKFDVEREAEAAKVTESAGGHRRQSSSKCDLRRWQCFKTLEVAVETPLR